MNLERPCYYYIKQQKLVKPHKAIKIYYSIAINGFYILYFNENMTLTNGWKFKRTSDNLQEREKVFQQNISQ